MGEEGWAEFVETDPQLVREQYASAPPNMQAALDVVRNASPSHLTYEEVELELGWPRGRLRSVIGGWRSRHGANYTRPYHICPPNLSPRDDWEMWMDAQQAQALA